MNDIARARSRLRSLGMILTILAGAAASAGQERFRRVQPNPDPLPQLRLPSIETHQLSNGLLLAVCKRDHLPLMSLQLVVLAGEAQSPDEVPGTATLAARMILQGTDLISAEDVQARIEAIGGEFTTSTQLDYSQFTFNFLEDYLDQALQILAPLLLQPAFPRRQLDVVKRTMHYSLMERAKDPEFLAKRQLLRLLFPKHPYRKGIFSEDVIKAISRTHVQAFYDAYYRPNNAILVLSGNLSLATATQKVSHYLNTWAAKDISRPPVAPPEPNLQERICLIDNPQMSDATLSIGTVVGPASSPDALPLEVLSQVLGGTPSSRLFMNLRETKGYAFYAFSDLELFKNCGLFLVRARVQSKYCGVSIREVLQEIAGVVEERVASFDIEQAKSRLIGNFPLRIEAFDRMADRVAEIKTFNLGEESWNRHYESIMLVNAESVYGVAQKYPLRTPVVVIVGDKNSLIDYLQDFAKVEVYNAKGVFQYNLTRGGQE
jgi:zinc protease